MALEMWRIDPAHSCIHFAIRYLGISKIHRRFTKCGGAAQFNEAAPRASRVEVCIDATSDRAISPDHKTMYLPIDRAEVIYLQQERLLTHLAAGPRRETLSCF